MQENVYFCTEIVIILRLNSIFSAYKFLFRNGFELIAHRAACGIVCVCVVILMSCGGRQKDNSAAPWGETTDSVGTSDDFDLDQIVANGEMIMLTISGPESYYDYRGKQLGIQYMMCQKFADKLGVSLRVEVCRDTAEMVRRLINGDADLIAYPLKPKELGVAADSIKEVVFCKVGNDSTGRWTVDKEKTELVKAVNEWYSPKILAEAKEEESFLLSSRSVVRHVYSPMLNRKSGVISKYDHLFMTYSRPIRWDWRMMAAQCYQESTFDPEARSWAGALGLMQIMPATAEQLGLPMSKIHDPESNIAAAAKFLGQLDGKFSDIPARSERIKFVLASYNGGFHHIRDAMALTTKNGGNPHSWNDVSKYVLLLSSPQYYRDPVVKYGYMRGSETVGYVSKIHQRWESYRGVRRPRITMPDDSLGRYNPSGMTPRKAKHHKKKYNI